MIKYELEIYTTNDLFNFSYRNNLEAINDALDYISGDLELDSGKNERVFEAYVRQIIAPGGMIGLSAIIFSYRVYTTYAEDTDITFIMADTQNSDEYTTEVLGFVYGGCPSKEEIDKCIGRLSAKYHLD